MNQPLLARDSVVSHRKHGRGRVLLDDGRTTVVRFDRGIEECLRADLQPAADLAVTVAPGSPLRVLARVLATAIQTVNDQWGVFANARVELLPHQLWVCRRVMERWPMRHLIADDVGLGKTIEAGLILTPLVASGRVRRLLILTPASLVEQWQQRLREMFDLRLARYTAEADTPRADFWGTHPFVVASAQTLRANRKDRWDRLKAAPPWDLVMVDEAHHVNHDERGGATLAYQLLEELQEQRRIASMVFFTGTPHRGKDFGFLALLRLLRPDLFDPRQPLDDQLRSLREVMIRNNKSAVTDMTGAPLFTPICVSTETYAYQPAEATFYATLTEYIQTGRAYASQMDLATQRTALLILITMQKLASSSVAAVRQALTKRLAMLRGAAQRAEEAAQCRRQLQLLQESYDPADADVRSALEERLAELSADVTFGPDEVTALEQLLVAGNAVPKETKIERIIDLIDSRFSDESVLLFTEYKATQALALSALRRRFGDGCATFINGDGRVEGVTGQSGEKIVLEQSRERAAALFNSGAVRFLVSTEAAGEGFDLQKSCASLIHVDLPWNPMRLHQRVGRLSRYGQRRKVTVVSLRNPQTVEGRIWECLTEKLERITQAFGGAMDDPEDMLQLVLGMSAPGEFERLFTEARDVPTERLDTWFDARAATFGGRRAIDVVKELFGSVARFDFGAAKADLPRVDLPDLLPFFKAMLALHRRTWTDRDGVLSFVTPDRWQQTDHALAERYEGLRFRREPPGDNKGDVGGVGHRVINAALQDAETIDEVLAAVPGLTEPIAVFVIRDRVTQERGLVRRILFAAAGETGKWRLLKDWELIKELNQRLKGPQALARADWGSALGPAIGPAEYLRATQAWLESALVGVELPFEVPIVDALALLVPTPESDPHEEASGGIE